MAIKKLLRDRFDKPMTSDVERFVSSIDYDWRLYKEDIEGSIAHVEMLAKAKIITNNDFELLKIGLNNIKMEIESGKFKYDRECEDIHMNIEKRLHKIIGPTASKLHTARSRNDQVALDMRLYIKKAIRQNINNVRKLQNSLVYISDKYINVIMPGFTHMQHAQPVLFSHHIMAYFEMLQRDFERLLDCVKHADVLPLGSGALAGVNYKIDRYFVARNLGFSKISHNSIDAVSDRDFIIEYISCASIISMHLSRLAEELIIWATSEFNFVEIDDSYCTTSSIMPQKKNPDILELVRGKTGRIFGNLVRMLTIMKGLPLSYNRDMQEDKESLFDVIDSTNDCLIMMAGVISSVKLKEINIYESAKKDYILATDVADYLVSKGLAFRDAHKVTARLVNYAIKMRKDLHELELKEYKKFSKHFKRDIFKLSLEKSVKARNNPGGTAPNQVIRQIQRANRILNSNNDK